MFWQLGSWSASEIDEVLDKEDVTLNEVLQKDEVIQECKAQNKKLIDFLAKESVMNQLVTFVTTEPSDELDEKERYKFANVACELLTSSVDLINDALLHPVLLDNFCLFLETNATLNPLLASFVSKILSQLTQKRTEPFLQHLKSKEHFIDHVLKHIQTSAMADFILKLITTVPKEHKNFVCDWLSSQQLIPKLVQVFNDANAPEAQTLVSQLLADVIKASRENQTQFQEKAERDVLLEEIESSATVNQIFDSILSTKTESSLVNGLFVLQSLLEYKRHNAYLNQVPTATTASDESPEFEGVPQMPTALFKQDPANDQMTPLDAARLAKCVSEVHAAVVHRIPEFMSILTNPPPKAPIQTAVGLIEVPLGATRLEVAHFIRALISGNNAAIYQKLREEQAFTVLLDLFLHYPWNNFLHTQVEQSIRLVFEDARRPASSESESSEPSASSSPPHQNEATLLATSLITESRLIHKLLGAYYIYCDTLPRPAFMGHLVKILDTVNNASQTGVIKQCLEEMDSDTKEMWNKFIIDVLDPTKSRIAKPLIADVNVTDFKDTQQLEAIAQRAYTEFKMQQMTKSSTCQYSFDTTIFADEEEKSIQSQADQLSVLNFNLDACNEEASSFVHSSQGEVINSDKVTSMDNDDGNNSSSDSEDENLAEVKAIVVYDHMPEDGDITKYCYNIVDRKRKMKDGGGKEEEQQDTVDMGQEEKKEEEETTAKDSEASQADSNPLNSIHNGRGEGEEEEEGEEVEEEKRKRERERDGENGEGESNEQGASGGEGKVEAGGGGGQGERAKVGQVDTCDT